MSSGRNAEELQGVHALGSHTDYPTDYAPQVLEAFPNKHPGNDYFVKFNCPEFTSLCPMTGQPDFATIYISYVPDEKLVESKSLKLYLFSFRNHGDFHEDCINIIMKDLVTLKCGANLRRVGACPLIPMPTMANRVPIGKPQRRSACTFTICNQNG